MYSMIRYIDPQSEFEKAIEILKPKLYSDIEDYKSESRVYSFFLL
jgi:hypothetical protein